MVVAGHPLAAEAGRLMLAQGGSAADATIAAAAVLCVALPHAVTLGGDAFGLFYATAECALHGLNATGRSPRRAAADRLTQDDLASGPRSATVPALLRGWEAAHRRFGRVAWAEVLAPAIAAAERGVPVSRILAGAIAQNVDLVGADTGLKALLAPGGTMLAEGDILQQPRLAESLRTLAVEGADAFYVGPIARSLTKRLESEAGLMALDDLAGCSIDWVAPLAVSYRSHTVVALPPNSFGWLGLLQLQQLDERNLGALEPEDRLAAQIAAAEDAFAAGSPYLADPEALDVAPHEVLAAAARRIPSSGSARIGSAPGGTAVAMAVDRDGNAALIVQSIFTLFGSGVFDAETGILLNNRMRGFSLDPGHPNSVAPGKRPAHTLSPMMLLRDGRLHLVLATPGGAGQTPTLVQVIASHIGDGIDLADAIAQSRWSYDLDRRVIVEPGITDETVAGLAARGLAPYRPLKPTPSFGSVKAIRVEPDGRLYGVSDRRRDGAVAAI